MMKRLSVKFAAGYHVVVWLAKEYSGPWQQSADKRIYSLPGFVWGQSHLKKAGLSDYSD
jgi:hypothetical protein